MLELPGAVRDGGSSRLQGYSATKIHRFVSGIYSAVMVSKEVRQQLGERAHVSFRLGLNPPSWKCESLNRGGVPPDWH
jgi:hypothetical protein